MKANNESKIQSADNYCDYNKLTVRGYVCKMKHVCIR